jgi:hypothetical protein
MRFRWRNLESIPSGLGRRAGREAFGICDAITDNAHPNTWIDIAMTQWRDRSRKLPDIIPGKKIDLKEV